MAFTHGTIATFAIDPAGGSSYTDISVYVEDVNQNTKTDTAETTALGNTAKTYIPGLENGQFKLKGFFDPTFDALLNSCRRVIVTFRYRPAGAGSGLPEYTGSAIMNDYAVDANVKDVTSIKTEFHVTGPISRGTQ